MVKIIIVTALLMGDPSFDLDLVRAKSDSTELKTTNVQ